AVHAVPDADRARGGRVRAAPLGSRKMAAEPVQTGGQHRPCCGGVRAVGRQQQLHVHRRPPALAAAARRRARRAIAVATLDLDRLAAELAGRADYGAGADPRAPALTAPPPPAPAPPPP